MSQTSALHVVGSKKVKIGLNSFLHRNPGSLQEVRMCRRQVRGIKEVQNGLNSIAPRSLEVLRGQNVSQTIALGRGGSLSSEKAFSIVVIVKQSDLGPHCLL